MTSTHLPRAVRRLESVNVAAEYVGVHPKTLRKWISTGQLAAYRAGPKLIRVDLDEIDAMLLRPILAGGSRG